MSSAPRIDSPRNAYVRFFRSLQSPKGRREHCAFLAENPRVIAEALAAGWEIVAAAVCEELVRPAGRDVAEALRHGPWRCVEVSERAFMALSTEQNPQGVAVACRCRRVPLSEIVLRADSIVVAAWDIADPGNMGAIIRTAEFLGCSAVAVTPGSVDPFEPKTVRATAGAIFHIPIVEAEGAHILAWARHSGAAILATAPVGGLPPEQLPGTLGPTVVLFGSEAHGLPPDVVNAASQKITIARRGKTESLNVAVAAGIVLSHLLANRCAQR
ncbi:MAG: RNA methyltransferase [Armatimonadetes bacterium]|nr:RNA methyltransferase [Armatimonadota bacterium]